MKSGTSIKAERLINEPTLTLAGEAFQALINMLSVTNLSPIKTLQDALFLKRSCGSDALYRQIANRRSVSSYDELIAVLNLVVDRLSPFNVDDEKLLRDLIFESFEQLIWIIHNLLQQRLSNDWLDSYKSILLEFIARKIRTRHGITNIHKQTLQK